jgi:exportin-2 (importin alpha re-exporter)|mmetsp:Transcript_930/g.2905  ORF Transcript_930/g.2905 Transcript_930/m.2905 type:complete len:976 (+) Transcript_930:54-2981(+)
MSGDQTQLVAALQATLSADATARASAEQFLAARSATDNFSLQLLQLAAQDGVDGMTRQCAAVAFKNVVKKHWAPVEPDEVGAQAPRETPESEKAAVRGAIVGLMLRAPKLVAAQMSEALSIVCTSDFPERWSGLLPELVTRLGTAGGRDFNDVAGVLRTANTIFKRYRGATKTEELYKELKYVLDTFTAPLLGLTQEISAALDASGADAAQAAPLLQCLRLICRIFFSLNSQELPEVFEDAMAEWMGLFHKFLTYAPPAGLASSDAEKASEADQLKAAVCDNINLYIEKNEEEFAPYLQTFVQDVWTLLMATDLATNRDHLVTSGVKFLTTVASSVHHKLFESPDTLRQVCENIILPNLQFRDDDEELFSDNHVEYIRRDLEGSDADTRRRGACELVKALTAKFPQHVTTAITGYVASLLQQYSTDPKKFWKAKDAAIYLVMALTIRSKSLVKGATETNDLVNIVDFFNQHIAPEIAAPKGGSHPVVRADALKFLTMFRQQIPKGVVAPLLPALVALLAAEENVVHSYAANCFERLLTVKEGPSVLRYASGDIAPLSQSIYTNLFQAFSVPDSAENEYVMKCVMRVIAFSGADVKPVATICLQQLSVMLLELCKNPRNPTFAHYLFESVASLLKNAGGDATIMGSFEQLLFPAYQHVLTADVVEFTPYVFQLLAQMIEGYPTGSSLPEAYMAIFPALLTPLMWDRRANVTPLVRLLKAYLSKNPQAIVSGGHLQGVLGVFQKLVSSKAQDHQGFYILNSFVESLALEAWADHLPTIWSILFQRQQASRTPKFSKSLIVFTCALCVKHGVGSVMDSMNKVQQGIFEMILENVVAADIGNVSGKIERKLACVAGTKFLTECPSILARPSAWTKLLVGVIAQCEKPEDAEAAAEDDDDAILEQMEANAGYAASYSKLTQGAAKDIDPVPDVTDVRVHVIRALSAFSQSQPLASALAQIPPECQSALASMATAAGVVLR